MDMAGEDEPFDANGVGPSALGSNGTVLSAANGEARSKSGGRISAG
jgi:hypothetical protein